MWGIITAEGQDSRIEKPKKKKKRERGGKKKKGRYGGVLKEGFLLNNLMSVCSRGHVGGPAAKPLGIEKKTKKKHVVTHTERTSHFTSTVDSYIVYRLPDVYQMLLFESIIR